MISRKALVAVVAGLVVVGGIVSAVTIGGIDNALQTIRSVRITTDGTASGTPIVIFNDPTMINDPANIIYLKKGAIGNATIAPEDIDWSALFSGA
jgi:hypothetical protein